jgi:hypothetical protein
VQNNPTTMGDPDGHQATPQPFICFTCFEAVIDVMAHPGQAWRDVKQSAAGFVQSAVNLLPYGDNKPSPNYQPPAGAQPSNSAVGTLTTVVLGAATLALPGPKGAGVVDMTATLKAPSMIGFSKAETGMIGQSLTNLSGAGYDLGPLQQLIKADMPPGCCGMSLSTPPTGAALGDGAFSSQQMLDHTLEEELLHLGQDLPKQTFGPGTAAANEAAVDAVRKIPEPPK